MTTITFFTESPTQGLYFDWNILKDNTEYDVYIKWQSIPFDFNTTSPYSGNQVIILDCFDGVYQANNTAIRTNAIYYRSNWLVLPCSSEAPSDINASQYGTIRLSHNPPIRIKSRPNKSTFFVRYTSVIGPHIEVKNGYIQGMMSLYFVPVIPLAEGAPLV